LGVPVVNGSSAYGMDISKALQLDAFETLGLPYPVTRVANSAESVVEAARGLRFPILVKANVGGSGAGIERYDDATMLEAAAAAGTIDFGVDGVGLVQEMAPLRDGHITRIEVLGGKYLYGINVFPAADSLFNLCPADVCQTTDGRALSRSACALDAPKTGMRVERADPSPTIVAEVERIASQVGLDVGGIELLVDDRDGRHYYYDVNALSNFVADARNVIGFDPHERLVDYLLDRAAPGRGAGVPSPVQSQRAGVAAPGAVSSAAGRAARRHA
jgi:glutathione synthase/RimK-type ligase-like ATP-grasp enzyme